MVIFEVPPFKRISVPLNDPVVVKFDVERPVGKLPDPVAVTFPVTDRGTVNVALDALRVKRLVNELGDEVVFAMEN